jgi:hypothetical protein
LLYLKADVEHHTANSFPQTTMMGKAVFLCSGQFAVVRYQSDDGLGLRRISGCELGTARRELDTERR